MVWSPALCPDGAKQDPVVNGAEFSVVFLAEGPRSAFIQEGLDCIGLYHSDLEGERYYFRLQQQQCRIKLLLLSCIYHYYYNIIEVYAPVVQLVISKPSDVGT